MCGFAASYATVTIEGGWFLKSNLFLSGAVALVATIAVEVAIAAFFGFRQPRLLLAIVACNLITNPLLNFILFLMEPSFSGALYSWILFLEILVVLSEWKLLEYAMGERSRCLLKLSFIINACSFSVGLLGVMIARICGG